jgi:hypothetical protein
MRYQSMNYRLCRDVRFRSVFDEGVAIRIQAGEALVVNGVGARVIELIEQQLAFDQMVEVLQQEYDVVPAKAREDLVTYLEELVSAGVVEEAPLVSEGTTP